MANTIDWGKATQNNTNGFGKYQNTIGAASIYEDSYSGETTLIGTSAAFSYSKSSFHQDESDPTPTITGTTGGTFSATPSGLSINTSTGTIDLDNSTIQSYTITYTVSGVSANFSLSVTASPFIANTFSMQFDGVDDYVDIGSSIDVTGNKSFSLWIKRNTGAASNDGGILTIVPTGGTSDYISIALWQNYIQVQTSNVTTTRKTVEETINTNVWYHIAVIKSNNSIDNIYINGVNKTLSNFGTWTGTITTPQNKISEADFGGTNYNFDGKIDEVAIWNTALGETAIQEIYNATNNNTGKALDLNTDSGNYNASSNLVYFNRLGD